LSLLLVLGDTVFQQWVTAQKKGCCSSGERAGVAGAKEGGTTRETQSSCWHPESEIGKGADGHEASGALTWKEKFAV